MTRWPTVPLADVATLNPTRPRELLKLPDSHQATFVPMPAVSAYTGQIDSAQTRPLAEVKKGFTYFAEGDVVFAKITPCMQNGKSAIARQLVNGLGFGSTEFHVIRPHEDKLLAEWVWHFVRQLSFRTQGVRHFQGAVGQQRVPVDYLGKALIPLPSLSEQRRIVARLAECMERVEEIDANAASVSRELDALFPALLNERFVHIREAHGARLLGDVADIRGGSSLPAGSSVDKGDSLLLIKVGDMNAEGNERSINKSREYLPSTSGGRGTVEAGAVIFPKRGGAIATNKKRLLGRSALLDPNLMAVVAKHGVLRPEFLYYWCLTLDLSKLSNGGVIPQLNRKDLAPLELPVPSVAIQGQIVEELKQAEQHCSQLKIEFAGAQADRARLREAILRKAFAGEL